MSKRSSDTESSFPRIPGYRIESVLGRGSMATVYKAVQVGMDRPVALKVLREDVAEDPKTVRRLMREARLAARLNHPHVVRAHDAGVADDGACYFVMEYIEGASVRDVLVRRGRFEEERAIDVAVEVAEALFAFYRQLIVHRDVKPANIMIDREGNALLADLGLAKIEFDSSMTSQNRAVGTPAYMSPEQARDPDNVDARTDIFSLGATLYHMVTGVSPFDAPTVGAVVTKILYDDPPPIRELDEELSPELERVVMRMIAKDRAERYETPGALLRDLRALRRGAEPPTTPPPSVQRNKTLWTGAVIAGVVVIGAASILFLGDDDAGGREETGPEVGSQDDASKLETRDLVELQPAKAVMRGEIERRLDRSLEAVRARVAAMVEREDLRAARNYLEGDVLRDVEAELKGSRTALPEASRERLDGVVAELRQTVRATYDARQARLLEGASTVLRATLQTIGEGTEYVTREEIEASLALVELPQSKSLDEDSRARLKRSFGDLAAELVFAWRERYEATLLEIRRLRDARRFASARSTLEGERARRPDRLGAGFEDRLTAAEGRIDEAEQELQRTLLNRIARIDRIPDDGHRELGTRETARLLATIREAIDRLPADVAEVARVAEQAALLRELESVVSTAHDLVHAIESAAAVTEGSLVDFDTLDGDVVRGAKVASALGETLSVQPRDGGELVSYSTRRIAPESLLALHRREIRSHRLVSAFLHYCDDDFLAAEEALAMARETPAKRLLDDRVSKAFAHFEKAASPESRAALGVWRASRAAAARGNWAEALAAAKRLVTDKALEKTEWYQLNREAIREHYERVRRLGRVARIVAELGGRWSVSPEGLVTGLYDFEARDDASGLSLSDAYQVAQGRLHRVVRSGSVAPDRTDPVAMNLAFDLTSESVDVSFRYRPSDRPELVPRCLTVTLGDYHLAFLGVLVGGGRSAHMPLHGRERDVVRRATFARVFSWEGAVSNYEAALRAAPPEKSSFRFEVGTEYEVRIVLDARTRRLTAIVDGELVHSRLLRAAELAVKSISLRAPMPHSLDDLRVRGSLLVED